MTKLAATAERLRAVKQAYRHFLTLWALDRMMNQPTTIDRFREDIEDSSSKAMKTFSDSNWSFLYRGSVLDD